VGLIALWCGGDMTYFQRKPMPDLWEKFEQEAKQFFADVKAGNEPEPFGSPIEVPLLKQIFDKPTGEIINAVEKLGEVEATKLAQRVVDADYQRVVRLAAEKVEEKPRPNCSAFSRTPTRSNCRRASASPAPCRPATTRPSRRRRHRVVGQGAHPATDRWSVRWHLNSSCWKTSLKPLAPHFAQVLAKTLPVERLIRTIMISASGCRSCWSATGKAFSTRRCRRPASASRSTASPGRPT
jgi:hypothetical protein